MAQPSSPFHVKASSLKPHSLQWLRRSRVSSSVQKRINWLTVHCVRRLLAQGHALVCIKLSSISSSCTVTAATEVRGTRRRILRVMLQNPPGSCQRALRDATLRLIRKIRLKRRVSKRRSPLSWQRSMATMPADRRPLSCSR